MFKNYVGSSSISITVQVLTANLTAQLVRLDWPIMVKPDLACCCVKLTLR